MAYKIGWMIPNLLIAMTFSGKLTLEDYQGIVPQGVKMTGSGAPPVHVISDGRAVTEVPTKLKEILEMMQSMGSSNANVGWIIQVTPNMFQRFSASLIAQWYVKGARFHACATITDALKFIKDRDPRFAPLDMAEVEQQYEAWNSSTVAIQA